MPSWDGHECWAKQLPPDRAGHAIATIERNAWALAHIIDDLLDVSRIVAGTLRLAPQPVDLVAVAAGGAGCRPAVGGEPRTCSWRSHPIPRPPRTVSGDAGRLQQVIWNLLANAIKFTPEGGRVDVFIERSSGHMEIRVVDTGQGISPDFLPHVFERFRQADDATTDVTPDSGSGWPSFGSWLSSTEEPCMRPVTGRDAARRSPSVCRFQRRDSSRSSGCARGATDRGSTATSTCRAYRGSMGCASWSSMTAPTGAL